MPSAAVMHRYGAPEVLEWRPVELPRLLPGEVRLRTLFSAVNRADLEIRSGAWPVQRDDPFPYTPGLEALGVVEEVGEGVTGLAPGTRAITMMQRLGGIHGERPGGYGEVVTVRADAVAPVPDDVPPAELAAVGLAGVTALEGLRRLHLRPGSTVVVNAASGGVGSVAVPLARAAGAHVVAVVSRARHADYVRALGAQEVVDLSRETVTERCGRRSVDAVLELLGARTFGDSVAALARGGRLCLVGALTGPELRLEAWDLMQELQLTGYSSENLTGNALRTDVTELVAALRTGAVAAPQHSVLLLRDAAEAHRRIEAGGLQGRVLLAPG